MFSQPFGKHINGGITSFLVVYYEYLQIKGRILGFGHTDYAETMYHLGRVRHANSYL